MAIKYRNVRNGRVVSVPEPKEVEETAPNEYVGRKSAMHQRRTIQRMDDSRTWQRAESVKSSAEPTPRTDGVHPAGGGWYEVVVAGEVVDKVRGSESANDLYAERTKRSE